MFNTALVTRDLQIKPQGDAISHPPDWQKLESLTIANVGKGTEQCLSPQLVAVESDTRLPSYSIPTTTAHCSLE